MDPDNYQQAWQAQSSQTRVTIDADLLLKEVQRNQRDFRATIFRRDFREVGIGLLYAALCGFIMGSLAVVCLGPGIWQCQLSFGSIGFILVDRMRHQQTAE